MHEREGTAFFARKQIFLVICNFFSLMAKFHQPLETVDSFLIKYNFYAHKFSQIEENTYKRMCFVQRI